MTIHARAVEPDRSNDHAPENAILDLVETSIRTALDLGLEPQLTARLDRLVPRAKIEVPVPMPAQPPGCASGQPKGASAEASEAPERKLELAAVLTACRQLATFKLSAGHHEAIARLKAWLVKEIGA